MENYWLNMDAARKIFQQEPAFQEALMYHVVAVSTDDRRYLWSAAPRADVFEVTSVCHTYGEAMLLCSS